MSEEISFCRLQNIQSSSFNRCLHRLLTHKDSFHFQKFSSSFCHSRLHTNMHRVFQDESTITRENVA